MQCFLELFFPISPKPFVTVQNPIWICFELWSFLSEYFAHYRSFESEGHIHTYTHIPKFFQTGVLGLQLFFPKNLCFSLRISSRKKHLEFCCPHKLRTTRIPLVLLCVLQAWKNPQKICKIGLRRTTILLLWTCSTILFAQSASILQFSLLTNCMNSLILSAH